jgi:GrpB-like predicted nucleotidyltransferase (UPF0157 family)
MTDPIIVVDYDPCWPERFQSLQTRIAGALGNIAVAIEHVGSTAVPNLAAKPIIDLDVLLATINDLPGAINCLAKLGYVHQGNLGIPDREALLAPTQGLPHHLYVCPPGSKAYQEHLAFRDYLRSNPRERGLYADLKRALAIEFRNDRSAYVDGKTAFIVERVNRARTAGCFIDKTVGPRDTKPVNPGRRKSPRRTSTNRVS